MRRMRTVLINGGSRGIGAAMVRRFAEAGDRVAFTYKNAHSEADRLAKETGALAVCADTAVAAEVTAAVERVREELGPPSVLINNAAVSSFSLFTDLTEEEWSRIFAVNVHGAFYYCRAVLPSMIAKKEGRIINVSSMWGRVGASCEVHYSATKAAINGMTLALAREVGPSGITVNAIAPGVIDTEMNRALSKDDLDALCEETPLGCIGKCEDIARTVMFLAGDGGNFITG
ncbi:MAG: SDR family oxidoreductase, partial [Clostridia bacterium]|nr:SDR family oxidoreductase [Clostridia bacterium]